MSKQTKKEVDINALVKELSAIKDLKMRSRKVSEKLKKLTPAMAAFVIEKLIRGVELGKTNFKSVYLSLIQHRDISKVLGYDFTSEIYSNAKEEGYSNTLELIRSSSVKKEKEAEAEQTALSRKLVHLTLGEKKALARRQDYTGLEFLMHDTDPSVIENLLKNPKITEDDVVKIAANKKAPKEVLEEIFKNAKWSSNYRVRKALVFNGETPIDVSLNLCASMLAQDLKLIMSDGKLDSKIKNRAGEILKKKKMF